MMTLLLAFIGVARADELTVNDGSTTNGYVPVYGYYADAYLKCEFVQPAADLAAMAGATINGVTFYASESSVSWGSANFQVFLTEVSSTSISDFYGPSTVVYEGALSISGGTMTINFTTPYTYNGGNLLVGVYNTATGTYVTCSWYGVSATGASVQGYSYSSLSSVTGYQRNFLPKMTFDYTGGGDQPAYERGLHTLATYGVGDNAEELIDVLAIERPNGAWMEPYHFNLYNDGSEAVEVLVIDFLHNNGYFTLESEVPFTLANNGRPGVDLYLNTNRDWSETEMIESLLAVNTNERSTHLFEIVAAPYTPYCPDVVEKAYDLGNLTQGTEWREYMSTLWDGPAQQFQLHQNYDMPDFEENIPDGYDAVMTFTVDRAMSLNARVVEGYENGKVALYAADFGGEEGPMANNYYTERPMNGGGSTPSGAGFEAVIGDETSTSTTFYVPFTTNYSYAISQSLYKAAELRGSGVTTAPMTSVSWDATSVINYAQHNIKIWMANVSDDALTNTSQTTSGMTLVYSSGNAGIMLTTGWNEFVFNQSTFAWDGHSNILVAVQRNDGEWHGNTSWRTHNPGFLATIEDEDDNVSYNIESQTYSMYTSSTYRANIKFKSNGGREMFAVDYNARRTDRNLESIATPMVSYTEAVSEYAPNRGNATIILTTDDVWQDGSGYQMLLDADATAYGTIIPETGPLTTSGDASAATYAEFEYKIPTNADGSLTTSNMVLNTSVSIQVPAGTYDWCITNPTPGDRMWIASEGGNVGGRADDYVFDEGMIYEFHVYLGGNNDATDVTITADPYNPPTPPTPPTPDNPNIPETFAEFSAGPVIENLNVLPGTYYLVASSTDADYEVEINVEDLPCAAPAVAVYPVDNAYDIEPTGVVLRWQLDPNCTEYRLVFSSTYWPEDNDHHPSTIITDWTNQLATSYALPPLWNNTNYFWRIEQRVNGGEENGGCTTVGHVFGFTTTLNIPHNLQANPTELFEGETTTLSWTAIQDRTYRHYNIYKDGELIYSTVDTPDPTQNCTWVVPASELEYNMAGYRFHVTALYDEGESDPSNVVTVKVSGYSATNGINGYVYEIDGTTPIPGVTVTVTGTDEFGDPHTYEATTNADGYYEMQVYVGTYTTAIATCPGYQDATPYQNGPTFSVAHEGHHDDMNFMMDEEFNMPGMVCAEPVYVPGVEGDTLVHIYWTSPFSQTSSPFEAQIGEGTSTTGYFPFYTLYNYSVATALYTAEELTAASVTSAPMTSLSWYATNSIAENQTGITIWMANVDNTTAPATSPLASGMTKVYTGSLNQPTPTGWVEFTFNEGTFAWDGTSNVMILVQRNCGDWTSSIQWRYTATSFSSMSYVYTDNAPYNADDLRPEHQRQPPEHHHEGWQPRHCRTQP